MKKVTGFFLSSILFAGAAIGSRDIIQESAAIDFAPATFASWIPAQYPEWVRGAGVTGGTLDENESCWIADASLPAGSGQCWIDIDRRYLHADLALTLFFEALEGSDMLVQLWDNEGRVVAINLFMNLIETALAMQTHTFIVPLQKYPTADRIVIRRLTGTIKIFGVVLTPVVSETEDDFGQLLALSRLLGDPLSSENPLVKAIRKISGTPTTEKNDKAAEQKPEPPVGTTDKTTPFASTGLAAYYDFDDPFTETGRIADRSGNGFDLRFARGVPDSAAGVFGRAILLNGSYLQTDGNPLAHAREFTVSLWFKTASPTDNYKLAAAARWAGGNNASGWNVGTHYSEFWADDLQGSLRAGPDWKRRVEFRRGEWNHLAVVYDGKRIVEYINGQTAYEGPGSGLAAGEGTSMTVGAWMGGFNFRGLMDDLRIYRRSLTGDEVRSFYLAAPFSR